VDPWVVDEEDEEVEKGAEEVEVMGERVDVAVAKMGVVGEGFVDEVEEEGLVIEV
jgi:hypothetical protein